MQRTVFWRLGAVVAASVMLAMTPLAAAGHAYEQPVWFNWDTNNLDVQVSGFRDPVVVRQIENAIVAWRTGIDDLDPDGLGDNVTIRDYIPGSDVAPPSGYQPHRLEIVVNPQGFFATAPFGAIPCTANAPLSFEAVYTDNGQYRVALHEFGHCLGLGHVFEHGVEYDPEIDPMGGGRDHRACPSNLNIRVMQRVFDDEGGKVTIDSGDYEQADCTTRTGVV